MSTNVSHQRPLPIIRLFVSSTFSDQQHERNALHAKVWPKLERYCQQRGFTFQAIDLRWGVPAEAGLHHRTMGVCFEELKRSQETSPEPNFLILLGNRYGWRPLPEVISTEEYGNLLKHSHGEAERAILETWYRLDTNAIPAVHLLRSRKDSPDGQDYTHLKDHEGNLVKKEDGSPLDTDHWLSVQRTLWEIVNRAFPATGLAGRFRNSVDTQAETVPSVVRFQTSATEQEIWQGALKVANAKEHVIACFREIQEGDVVPPPQERKKFVDLQPNGTNDGNAQSALAQLKNQLEGRLDAAKIIWSKCQWATIEGGQLTGDVTTEHITKLCDDVYKLLEKIVIKQINEYWGCDLSAEDASVAQVRGTKQELDIECADHQRFAEERAPAGAFIGRDDEIALIQKYLTQPTNHPLIVHGPSGSGKTALLGKVIQEVTPRNPDGSRATAGPLVLSRFIGTTPESSNLRSLLSSLCRVLRQEFPVTKTEKTQDGRTVTTTEPLPTDLNLLVGEFYSQLGQATAARPIYVFLDALDQIEDTDDARSVYWIWRELVSPGTECHARLVATCLSPSIDASEDELTEDSKACEPYRVLKSREMLSGEPLGILSEEQAHKLFRLWLKESNRSLSQESPEQDQLIQSALSTKSCHSPLYLKVLFEEARRWRSFDKAPLLPKSLPNTLQQLLAALLDRLDQLSEHGPLVRIVLSLLVSARYGLSEGELLEILFQDKEFSGILAQGNKQYGHELPPLSTRIPIAPWTRLRSDLAPYLADRSAPGTAVLYFYHRQVEMAVRVKYLKTAELQARRWADLAKYFSGRWNLPEPHNLPNAHALMELPHLLLLIQDHDTLLKLLTDLPFPMRKIHAGYVSDLLLDYDNLQAKIQSETNSALSAWNLFCSGNASFLRQHPTSIFQQAFNEPRQSPVFDAAQKLWSIAGDLCDPSTRLVPNAFLEWLNRPGDWQEPACRMTLIEHTGDVFSVAISMDGTTIISGSADHTVKLWDTRTGACKITLRGHEDSVFGVAITRDGTRVISGSGDKTIKLWDTRTGDCISTLVGHTESISSISLSGDGFTIASGSFDKTVRLWSTRTGDCLSTLTGPVQGVRCVAICADATTVVTAESFGSTSVWDMNSRTRIETLQEPAGVLSVALFEDEMTVVSGSEDQTVKLWDARTGVCRSTLHGNTGWVYSVAFSGDGTLVASGSGPMHEFGPGEPVVKVWDVQTQTCLASLQGHTQAIECVALSHDGNTVVSGSRDRTIKVWNVRTTARMVDRNGHSQFVDKVVTSADGSTIVSGSIDQSVRVWDARTESCVAMLQEHPGIVYRVTISADGARIATWSDDNTIKVWDARTGVRQALLKGHTSSILDVIFSGDASTVISGAYDSNVNIWDAKGGMCRATLQGQMVPGASMAVSRNGATVVTLSKDHSLKVWEGQTGECRKTLPGHTAWISEIAISHDASTIFSRSDDRTVRVWDSRTGLCRKTLLSTSSEARSVWPSISSQTEQLPCEIVNGALSIQVSRTGPPLVLFGPFEIASELLVDSKILAFNSKGEDFWLRIRRRDDVLKAIASIGDTSYTEFHKPVSPSETTAASESSRSVCGQAGEVHWRSDPRRVSQLQTLYREVHRHWSSISPHVPFWIRPKSAPPNPSCDTLQINPFVLQSHVAEYERQCQQWITLSWWQKKTTPPPKFPSIQDIVSESARAPNA